MNEDDLKNFKVELDYADKDGNQSVKSFTVKVNKVKDIGEKGYGWQRRLYSLSFSITMPDHYYEELLGKSVPTSTMGNRNHERTYNEFSKTITAESLKSLCETYWTILQDYCWIKKTASRDLQKVIFYQISSNSGEYKSGWDGTFFGKNNSMNFLYSIGYIGNSNTRHNEKKTLIGSGNNREFYQHKFVSWTPEREAFFDKIQQSFDNIIGRLTDFENNLTEETINNFINDSKSSIHLLT